MHRHAKNNDSNRFCNFYKRVTDRQTNVPTDGPMDQLTDGDAIAASKNDPLLCINYSLRNAIRFFFTIFFGVVPCIFTFYIVTMKFIYENEAGQAEIGVD